MMGSYQRNSMQDGNQNPDPALGLLIKLVKVLGLVPETATERISGFVGSLVYRLAGRHRAIAIDNLTMAMGDQIDAGQIRRIVRRVFHNLCRMVFEIGWSLRLSQRDVGRWFAIEGAHHYRQVFASGRGVLFVLSHFGNWELLPCIAALMGHPIHIVYRPLDNPLLERFIRFLRFRFGAGAIATHPRGDRAMARVIRCLRNGEGVGMLMDQNVDWYEGVFVDFFGRRACTSRSAAMLAARTGAAIVPCFIVRQGRRFKGVFGPVLEPSRTGDGRRDIEDTTQAFTAVIEAAVRRRPDQWFWVHQRWKTKPYCRLPRTLDPANGEIIV